MRTIWLHRGGCLAVRLVRVDRFTLSAMTRVLFGEGCGLHHLALDLGHTGHHRQFFSAADLFLPQNDGSFVATLRTLRLRFNELHPEQLFPALHAWGDELVTLTLEGHMDDDADDAWSSFQPVRRLTTLSVWVHSTHMGWLGLLLRAPALRYLRVVLWGDPLLCHRLHQQLLSAPTLRRLTLTFFVDGALTRLLASLIKPPSDVRTVLRLHQFNGTIRWMNDDGTDENLKGIVWNIVMLLFVNQTMDRATLIWC